MLQVSRSQPDIFYPESDGKPMADNTQQFRWIVLIQQNLQAWYANDPQIFVAGDLLWYPVEGDNKTCQAPDAMVILGRPKGDRGSYQQWKEGGIAPQVVFEIRSPSNSQTELDRKLMFYDRYGVEEYYLYDPDRNDLSGWLRRGDRLAAIEQIADWISPCLKIRFHHAETLHLYCPDGVPFTTLEAEQERADRERQRADQECQRAEQAERSLRAAVTQLLNLGMSADQVAATLGVTVAQVQALTEPS